MRKISKQHLALFLNIHRWKGEKNQTRQHFAILTEIIIRYLLVPQHIARQSLPLIFRVLKMENRSHAKSKGGTELGRVAEHLGTADCLVLCDKCTEVSF